LAEYPDKNLLKAVSELWPEDFANLERAHGFSEPLLLPPAFSYLRHILGFFGLTDMAFVQVENQAMAEAAASVAVATERIGKPHQSTSLK
jgi:hypothetical protein